MFLDKLYFVVTSFIFFAVSAQSSDATTGGIIGGVLGAVVLVTGVICILVMLIVVMRLKRRKMEVEHLQMAVLTRYLRMATYHESVVW